MTRRVVITGIGIVAPNGAGAEQFWAAGVSGKSWLRTDPLMPEIGMKSKAIAPIEGFDLADHHDPADAKELAELSRFVQLSVTANAMAGRDGGLDRAGFDGDRAGVVFSSAIGGTPEFQKAYERFSANGTKELEPFPEDFPFYDSVFLNYTAAWTARRFGLRGAATTLTTGCTAGIDSLGLAFDQVRYDDLDLAVASAGEAPLSGLAYATLDVIGSLSVAEGPVERASRPFDAGRAGFVLGEGAAALVLEEYEHAKARGARIYAEVCGFASANNAFHMSDLAPDGRAMAAVMTRSLDDAQVAPTDIDYVNAHGSSTPQNDVFETQALKQVLGAEHAARTPISSTKSMIGHSLSSASLVGTVAAVGALRYGVVPPTANYADPDPQCDLDYVPNVAREHPARTVLVSASGFGGIHSCAVLRRVGQARTGWYRRPATETGLRRERLTGTDATVLRTGVPGSGPDVLLLHGFAGSAAHWAPVLECLGQDVHAVAVDLPGHGSNTLPADGGQAGTRRFLLDALDELGLDAGVTVVGHSYGGVVATQLAATSRRAGGLVLLGTGTPLRLHPGMRAQVVGGELDEEFLAAALLDDQPRARELLLDGFRAVRMSEDTDLWGVSTVDPAELLRAVTVPTAVLVPAADRVVSPRKGRALGALVGPDATTVIPDADHYVHLENPDTVAALILAHLGTAATTRRAG